MAMYVARPTLRPCLAAAVVALALGAAVTGAWGQGFMVKPMSFDIAVSPSTLIDGELEIRNTSNERQALLVRPFILGQGQTGGWMSIDPEETDKDVSQLRTCVQWVRLDPGELELDPGEVRVVRLYVRVPPGSRGFYSAAIVVENQPVRRGSFRMVLRFLLPVRISILGAPARERIELKDVRLRYVDENDREPRPSDLKIPTTVVGLEVANSGDTYGKLTGKVTVMREAAGRWRRTLEAPIPERGIIPGVSIAPLVDLRRRLPSGRYRVHADLVVNGRRVRGMISEFDFQGDPTVGMSPDDVDLRLAPVLEMEGYPGARRSVTVPLENLSDMNVSVETAVTRPAALAGVAMGDVTGDEFTCADWVQINPTEFTLRAGAERNLRLVARFPDMERAHANYYAEVVARAAHRDGQTAGEARSLLWLRNSRATPQVRAEPLKLELAHHEGDEYVVSVQFVNVGDTHFKAPCSANVVDVGGQLVASAALETTSGIILPLGTVDYSGLLDFSRAPAGDHTLIVTLDLGPHAARDQLRVRVEEGDEGKVVTVLQMNPAAASAAQTAGGANDEEAEP